MLIYNFNVIITNLKTAEVPIMPTSKNILIATNDLDVKNILTAMIKEVRYNITVLDKGSDVLLTILEQDINFIILDTLVSNKNTLGLARFIATGIINNASAGDSFVILESNQE